MRLTHKGEYPANWLDISTATKEAAGGKCIRCGHANDRETGHVLTVHHLDGDKSNVRWWNLLALCQRCHLTVQAHVIPDRTWMFKHSLWFQPYVAGYYAASSGNHLPRATIEANLNYWLTVGQPWLAPTPSTQGPK